MKIKSAFFMLATLVALNAQAKENKINVMDEFDPSAADAMETVEAMTEEFQGSIDHSVNSMMDDMGLKNMAPSCVDRGCSVFIDVNMSKQSADLFLDGQLAHTWKISSAKPGKVTKRFNGIIARDQFRIFDAKTSTTYQLKPGQHGYIENGKDMGNMPYAVFYYGPYAFHGTTAVAKLGTPASAGCIRLHPDNAKKFNRAVRAHGRLQTWVNVD